MHEAVHWFSKSANLVLRPAISVQELNVELFLDARLEVRDLDVHLSPFPVHHGHQRERHANVRLCRRRRQGLLIVQTLGLSEPLCYVAALAILHVAVLAGLPPQDQRGAEHRLALGAVDSLGIVHLTLDFTLQLAPFGGC